MAHKLKDIGRRDVNFINDRVTDVLPEYFQSEYPEIIQFLNHYYDYLDSDHNFGDEIKGLFKVRDIGEAHVEHLNSMIAELGSGLQKGDIFKDARFTARRFADHYRNKGSRFSTEEFFRTFFGQEVEVVYPKKDVFTVGEDKIGYDSLKFIQDYARYQIFSVLLRVGLGVPTYRALYKKFVHPAGFYFEGEVATEGQANFNINQMPISVADVIENSIVGRAFITPTATTNITGLIDSNNVNVRYDLTELASKYATQSIDEFTPYYTTKDLIDPNSPTLDDSDTIISLMSTTSETMDEDIFRRYGSDSTY